MLNTHRNKQVRNLSLVLLPVLTILPGTPFGVPPCTMKDHGNEEARQEPGDGARKTTDKAPGGHLSEVGSIVNLASQSVCVIKRSEKMFKYVGNREKTYTIR